MTTPVEDIKARSRLLRGTILEGLANGVTGALDDDDTQLTKFHGTYQQDDRDLRSERRRQKLEPAYSFMIRARVPAGLCSSGQWLAMDELARRYANDSLRLTTRQAFQFHGVVKRDLKTTMRGINDSLLDTLAACGDVNRNVMSSANPRLSEVHAEVAEWAARLSDHLTPQTGAYHEIWLDGEKLDTGSPESEPIYGETYLPRKFKTGFAVPPDNDVDVFSQDLGFIAIVGDGELLGFDVVVGGGMGMSHGEPDTYPRLADLLGFVTPDQVLAVAEAVVTAQRDHGDRDNRKHARLKYTIADRGLDWFRQEVERRAGFTLADFRAFQFKHNGDRLGWVEGADALWHYTAHIPSGRVVDTGHRKLLTGLREVARIHSGGFRLTANQNVIISDVPETAKAEIQSLLEVYGLANDALPSTLSALSLACVALPTCGQAMAEAERYLPDLLTAVEGLLADHGLTDAPITLRITGCPNGCARPYLAEIGLVGKGPGKYNLFLGGDFQGQRLNRLYRHNIGEAEILAALDPLLAAYSTQRSEGEGFGDFLLRAGHITVAGDATDFHHTPEELAA